VRFTRTIQIFNLFCIIRSRNEFTPLPAAAVVSNSKAAGGTQASGFAFVPILCRHPGRHRWVVRPSKSQLNFPLREPPCGGQQHYEQKSDGDIIRNGHGIVPNCPSPSAN
jgi:hypothetical protein